MRLHHFRSHFILNFDSSDPFHTYSCAFAAIVFCLLLISKSSIKSVTYNLGASVFTEKESSFEEGSGTSEFPLSVEDEYCHEVF